MDSTNYGRVIAENIALLSLLSRVPEPPARNTPSADQLEDVTPNRTLSFQRECDIVDNLAFISAISDDAEMVTAVCIEEKSDGTGLTVMLAVNDGSLEALMEGFKKIFMVLEEVALNRGNDDRNEHLSKVVQAEIVALNRGRILSRLRSIHATESIRNRGKPALGTLLASAARLGRRSYSLPRPVINAIVAESKIFQGLFEDLEAYGSDIPRSHTILELILQSAYRLTAELQIDLFLDGLPNHQDLHPSGREGLLTGLQKVGRYRSVSDFLIRAARRCSVFKRIDIKSVPMPVSNAVSLSMPVSGASLERILERLYPQVGYRIEEWCKTLGGQNKISSAVARREFIERVQVALNSSRVHAEIQILYYYETQQVQIPPRVICSSKSACFLCNLLIQFHGKFYVARTHGKLYERWKIPTLSDLQLSAVQLETQMIILQRFNSNIEDRIRKMLRNRRRLSHLHPNESVFIKPPSWTPSGVSLTKDESTMVAIASSQSSSRSDEKMDSLSSHSSKQAELEKLDTNSTRHDEIELSRKLSEGPKLKKEYLVQGRRIHRQLGSLHYDHYFIANHLQLFLDSSIIPTRPVSEELDNEAAHSENHFVEIEWLRLEDSAFLIDNEGLEIVNVNEMQEGSEVSVSQGATGTNTHLHVVSMDTTISLRCYSQLKSENT